jgi:hypothetical protein
MVKRAHVYLVLATAWRKVETFNTHAERERWLGTEKVIGDNFSTRELYQIFGLIGLLGAEPGRPKKSES